MNARQELTMAACDALAAMGKKPSLSLVRQWTTDHGGKRGSDPDVQADINQWYADLLKLKQEKLEVPGLPDKVAQSARAFWLAANEAAAEKVEAAIEATMTREAEAQRLVDAAVAETAQHQGRLQETASQLAVTNASIAGRDEIIRRFESNLAEQRGIAAIKDERIAALTDDLARRSQEHAAAVVQLDGLRKHSLMQIDETRSESRHWRAEFERVDTENRTSVQVYRQKADNLSNKLAGAEGRLEQMKTELVESRARTLTLEIAMADMLNTRSDKNENTIDKRKRLRQPLRQAGLKAKTR